MQQHLDRALTFLRGGIGFLWKALKEVWLWARTNKKWSIPLALVLMLGVGALAYFANSGTETAPADDRREVSLVSVADVSSGEPISVIGEIQSVSEADVAPDSSGRVTGVYRSIGDAVSAGTVIAEIENAAQRAAVEQAEAALARVQSGATLSGISVESALAAGETARQSAYAAINDAVTNKADAAFSNPTGSQPLFYIAISDFQLKNTLESERLALGIILKRHASSRTTSLAQTELLAELDRIASEAEDVREFLSHLVTALSLAIPTGSVTEAQIASASANASGALSTITALQGSLASAEAAIKSASENLTQGRVGESADVAQARAALNAAQTALEKTIVRAPIAGTISSISLERGNFAAAGAPAIRIVNVNGLEAIAYLSEKDLPRVSVGSSARISGIANGRVSRIAPALDPKTRKAEIRITLGARDEGTARFVPGQSATIELSPARNANDTALFIPISSIKITPDGAVVFIATTSEEDSASAILESLPVTLGTLTGGKIEITSGLSLENVIVADARGLKEGQEVVIAQY